MAAAAAIMVTWTRLASWPDTPPPPFLTRLTLFPPLSTPDGPGWHHDAARVLGTRERNADVAKHARTPGSQLDGGDLTTEDFPKVSSGVP
ncbi:hypothetical protein GCM10028793_28610 [Nocardiopsis oceani]